MRYTVGHVVAPRVHTVKTGVTVMILQGYKGYGLPATGNPATVHIDGGCISVGASNCNGAALMAVESGDSRYHLLAYNSGGGGGYIGILDHGIRVIALPANNSIDAYSITSYAIQHILTRARPRIVHTTHGLYLLDPPPAYSVTSLAAAYKAVYHGLEALSGDDRMLILASPQAPIPLVLGTEPWIPLDYATTTYSMLHGEPASPVAGDYRVNVVARTIDGLLNLLSRMFPDIASANALLVKDGNAYLDDQQFYVVSVPERNRVYLDALAESIGASAPHTATITQQARDSAKRLLHGAVKPLQFRRYVIRLVWRSLAYGLRELSRGGARAWVSDTVRRAIYQKVGILLESTF